MKKLTQKEKSVTSVNQKGKKAAAPLAKARSVQSSQASMKEKPKKVLGKVASYPKQTLFKK